MSGETILITRPLGDEVSLSDALHELGMRVIHEPLTEIFLNHAARGDVQMALVNDPDAILVTSRHGVRALAVLTELRDLALICVGDATADAAYSSGFTRVTTAGGNIDDLITLITGAYDDGARFLYISAADVSADIPAALEPYDMKVDRVIVYEAIAREEFSDVLTEQLKRNQIDAVTFLSQRAAQIFVELQEEAELESATQNMHAFCMSAGIAAQLNEQAWESIQVAEQPTLASVVECVDNAFGRIEKHG